MQTSQNVQTTSSTPGTQNTQNNQTNQNITINNHQMAAPDETSYHMPPDTVSGGSWIYGNPNLSYNGQPPSGGVSVDTMHGSTPADSSSAPMPIPGMSGGASPMPIPGMNGGASLEGISSAAAQSHRMKNPVDMESTHMPAGNSEAYQASLRSLLDRNVGFFVVVTFLMGTQQSVTWQGILHTVGSDYIVLYQPDYERYVSCDFYAIKFVQFHNVKGVPYCAASRTWQGQSGF